MAGSSGDDALSRALADYRAGKHAKAIRALRLLLKARPDHADAANLLGAACLAAGEPRQAADAFEQAVRLQPTASHHFNLGQACAKLGRWDRAIAAYEGALALDADHAGALAGLGSARRQAGDREGALDCLRRAVQLAPGSAPAHYNLALALHDIGDHAAAGTAARTAIGLRPDYAEAQFLLAELALRVGNWVEGWARYEHRFRLADSGERSRLLVPAGLPPWNGSARPGDAVLLICEQGFGDTFMFIRYAETLAARGVAVDVAVPPACAEIVASARGVRKVVVKAPPARGYVGWLPLASLPRILGVAPTNLPPPYLRADDRRTDAWRCRLEELAQGRMKVGLTWAGSTGHPNDANRSLSLAKFAPLASPDHVFFGMQKGPAAAEHAPPGMAFFSLDRELGDFADTAAALSSLDLLISVDTSVANLAGALALPAWALLGTPPEWRWGPAGQDSPWYPGIRCFRQERPGDWDELLARVGTELRALPH